MGFRIYDRGTRGSLFSSATQNTTKPVTAPKADNARWTGTKNARRCGDWVLWGCFKTCINLVPFHHLWIDGDATKKSPPCTLPRLWRRPYDVSYF